MERLLDLTTHLRCAPFATGTSLQYFFYTAFSTRRGPSLTTCTILYQNVKMIGVRRDSSCYVFCILQRTCLFPIEAHLPLGSAFLRPQLAAVKKSTIGKPYDANHLPQIVVRDQEDSSSIVSRSIGLYSLGLPGSCVVLFRQARCSLDFFASFFSQVKKEDPSGKTKHLAQIKLRSTSALL